MKYVRRGLVTLFLPLAAQGLIARPGERDRHLPTHHAAHHAASLIVATKGSSLSTVMPSRSNVSTKGHTLFEDIVAHNKSKRYRLVGLRRPAVIVAEESSAGMTNGAVVGLLVILLCVLLACGCLLTQLMRGESSVLRPETAFSHWMGPRVGDLQPPPRTMSGRFQTTSEGSPLPSAAYGGVHPHASSRSSQIGPFSSIFSRLSFSPPTAVPKAAAMPNVPRAMFQTKPIPICPELVIAAESWYAIGFESIDSAAGPVPIYGRGQQLVLTARIHKDGPGAGSVEVEKGGGILGSISSSGGALMVQDRHKRPYGELHSVGHMAYSFRYSDVEAMKMSTDTQTGRILLVNPTEILASASRCHDNRDLPSPEAHLGISVVAGMDPVLTILCIVGAMALAP